MTRRKRFPGAPAGSYVCEEGWLVIGDEAWTEEEWRVAVGALREDGLKYRNRYGTETERRAAHRESNRRWRKRSRLGLTRPRRRVAA